MRPLDERFLAAVAEERARLRSRRALIADGAKVAGGGALALLAIHLAPGAPRLARAQDFADDLDILNYALTLEHLEAAFYRVGLETFDEEDFADADAVAPVETDEATPGATPVAADVDVPRPSRARLEEIRDHEAAHVQALTDTIVQLGGSPVPEGAYDFGGAFDDLGVFLETAQALENTGVAAYAGAAAFIFSTETLAAALGIHSVEARHAAYLNEVNGGSPFPDAVDASLTRAQVLEIAGAFIVSQGTPAAAAPPAGTGDADNDALTDAEEADLGTDPNNPDTDGDGLVDVDEFNLYGTNGAVFDTDGDGVGDGDEVAAGTNPLDPASF